MSKPSPFLGLLLLLLLIATVSVSQKLTLTEARTLSFLPKQENSEIFPTLGVVCKCCDGVGSGGECPTTWKGSCHDLQCLPWKIA